MGALLNYISWIFAKCTPISTYPRVFIKVITTDEACNSNSRRKQLVYCFM